MPINVPYIIDNTFIQIVIIVFVCLPTSMHDVVTIDEFTRRTPEIFLAIVASRSASEKSATPQEQWHQSQATRVGFSKHG